MTEDQKMRQALAERAFARIEASHPATRPLFTPCVTCPDKDWCGANDCWWNADQVEP